MAVLRVNGVGLAYELVGPAGAPVVALSNSLATDARMWRPQLGVLAERYRVLTYDTRGHGQSEVPAGPYHIDMLADDLAGLIRGLGLGPTHVVGLSLGGMTAQVLAMRRPELVASLCLVATTCRPPFGTQNAWAARAAEAREAGDYSAILGPMMERWLTRRFRRARPGDVAFIAGMIEGTPIEGYAGCCEAIGTVDACGRLAKFAKPVRIFAGEEDPGTTVEDAQMIAGGIAGSELIVVPHARHLLNWDAEEFFTPRLLEWLDRVV